MQFSICRGIGFRGVYYRMGKVAVAAPLDGYVDRHGLSVSTGN